MQWEMRLLITGAGHPGWVDPSRPSNSFYAPAFLITDPYKQAPGGQVRPLSDARKTVRSKYSDPLFKPRPSNHTGYPIVIARTAVLLSLVLFLSGCATNPATGHSQLMLVSEVSAISDPKEAYVEMLQPLDEKGKLDNNAEMTGRVHEITSKLIAQAIMYRPETEKRDWRVKVIDDPETVNAFCMAGGKTAIYSGPILKLDATDDEIAQVLGHEIAHALSAHTAEPMSIAMATSLAATGFPITQD